jgi:hypothetical protein
MSLPPELGAIDDAWGEDEQPTIARPSRVPTAPARIEFPGELPTAPGFTYEAPSLEDAGIELEAYEGSEELSIGQRVTSVPEVPLDEFARRAMRSDSAAASSTEAPAPRAFVAETAPTRQDHITRQSDIPTGLPESEVVTAPAHATEMTLRSGGHLPKLSDVGISLEALTSDAAPPPLSQPRADNRAHTQRFSSTPPNAKSAEQKMKERFAIGDFSGALDIAEKLLKAHPQDADAKALASKCREVLEDMYSSRISGLHRVPTITMGPDQIRWLSLDHRSGFLLSMIDGISSVDDLLDVSGMQRLDALRIICELLDQRVIGLS